MIVRVKGDDMNIMYRWGHQASDRDHGHSSFFMIIWSAVIQAIIHHDLSLSLSEKNIEKHTRVAFSAVHVFVHASAFGLQHVI